MKGLTVRQPYAGAIALSDPRELGPELGKGVENRTWKPWPEVIGEHIAISAGQAVFEQHQAIEIGRMLYGQDALHSVWPKWLDRLTSSFGKIVCVARVAGVVGPQLGAKGLRESQRRWKEPGGYGWVLDDVRALSAPIQVRGAQGLWHVPPGIEKVIRAQVGL